jgi:prophage regulatory protein
MPKTPMRILRRPEVELRTGLSNSQRDILEARGEFPRRVPLGPRTVGWIEAEIDAWCAERIAARDDRQRRTEAYQARLPEPVRRRREPHRPNAA